MTCSTSSPCRRSRPARAAAGLALAALLLASTGGCSLFRSTDPAAPAAVATPEPTHHEIEDNSYPVSVTHRYGETTLTEPPGRIVTLGIHDQDTLIALGLRPVGIRDWLGTERAYADWPWAPEDLRPDEPPVASPRLEIDFEAVAALDPDLITAVHSDLTEEEYAHLTEIAPTIAQVEDVANFQASWQEETRLMGKAVGRPQQAETVVSDLEATFSTVRDEFPVLSDADVALVEYRGNGALRLVNPYDPRARMLAALGMRFPDAVAEAVEDAEFDAGTNLAMLAELPDLDAIIWLADPSTDPGDAADAAAELVADPAYAELDVVRRGGSVFLADSEAVSFTSGLSLAYAAERNGAAIADALDAKAADRNEKSYGLLPDETSGDEIRPRTTRPPRPGRLVPRPTATGIPGTPGTPAPAPAPAPATPAPADAASEATATSGIVPTGPTPPVTG